MERQLALELGHQPGLDRVLDLADQGADHAGRRVGEPFQRDVITAVPDARCAVALGEGGVATAGVAVVYQLGFRRRRRLFGRKIGDGEADLEGGRASVQIRGLVPILRQDVVAMDRFLGHANCISMDDRFVYYFVTPPNFVDGSPILMDSGSQRPAMVDLCYACNELAVR